MLLSQAKGFNGWVATAQFKRAQRAGLSRLIRQREVRHSTPPLGLHKMFVYFEAVLHESTIFSFPPPTCTTCIAHPGAILLHDEWKVYDSPSDLPFVCYTPYNIGNNNIV